MEHLHILVSSRHVFSLLNHILLIQIKMVTKMRTSETMYRNAFAEFLGCWAAGGEATLSFTTKGGKANISFTSSQGKPSDPLLPSSPPPPRHRRRRGPAKKKRDQERAARHQATLASSPSFTSSSNSLAMAPVVVAAEEERTHTCKRCKLPCKGHPAPGPGVGRCQVPLDTPCTPPPLENLREGSSLDHTREEVVASPTLNTTREEEASPTSPTPCWNCSSTFTPNHQCGESSEGTPSEKVDPDTIKAEWKTIIKEIADLPWNEQKRRRELMMRKLDLNDLADEHGILLD